MAPGPTMKLRLTPRIGLYFMTLAVALVAGVAVLSYRSGRESLEAATVSQMLATAVEKQAALNAWIEERLDDIEQKASQPDVVRKAAELIAAVPGSAAARSAHTVLLRELQPHVDSRRGNSVELFVMEPVHGTVVASTRPAEEGKSKFGHVYFDNGRTRLFLQPMYRSADTGAPGMTAAVPLRAPDGRTVAVLAYRLNVGAMSRIVERRADRYRTEDAFLVNSARFVITQPRFIEEPAVLRRRVDTEAVRRVTAHQSGVIAAPDYRGVPVICAYRWLAAWDFGLLVKIDEAEALAPAAEFGRSVLYISGLALLAAACLALLLAHTVTKPLHALHRAVQRFASGMIAEPLPESADDELGLLAREFNAMAVRVAERTALLDNIINATPDFIIVKNLDLRTILCNETVARAIGKRPEELYGKTDIENGWPHEQVKGNPSKSIGGFETDDRRALAGITVHNPSDPANVGNDTRYFDTVKVPLRDAQGAIIGVLGISRDVTERTRASEEREKFLALIENTADFIGMATLEGKPFYLNKAGRELVGLAPDHDVSSTSISEYFDEDSATLLRDIGIPTSFAVGQWIGEGRLRHFRTHALVPVHMHSFLVRSLKTHEPIGLACIMRNISDIKDAENNLQKAHRELVDVSRLAGMAEIATNVLHNVGNVLNSVNVSADRIAEKVKRLSPASLAKVAALLREHAHDLPDFLARDPQGMEVPGYLSALIEQCANPQKDILPDVAALRKNIEHIREIVRMQQTYAGARDVLETTSLADLMEDAIQINAVAFARHEMQVMREYSPVPAFAVEKHKVLQILVNLLSNAKDAVGAQPNRAITVRVEMNADGFAKASVTDNGIGIPAENLTRIFQHGFTTRKDGHGFGLHSGALAANEMGGSLTVWSGGPGKGAVFTLQLPCERARKAA